MFICHLYLSLNEIFVMVFGTFFNQVVCFLLVNFKSSSYILDNNPFSIGALQVFLFPVCDVSFHSLDSVFHRAENK